MARRTGGQVNDQTGRVEKGRMPKGSLEDACVIKDRSHLKPWNWRR
jgi:hypothetical protein